MQNRHVHPAMIVLVLLTPMLMLWLMDWRYDQGTSKSHRTHIVTRFPDAWSGHVGTSL
jgi:hypothetical protein